MSREQKSLCRKPCHQLILHFYGVFFSRRKFSLLLPLLSMMSHLKLGKNAPFQSFLPLPSQSDAAPAKSVGYVFTASLIGVKYESNLSQILPAG